MPFLDLFVGENFEEFALARYLIAAFFACIFLGSFVFETVAKQIDNLFFVGMGLLSALSSSLLVLNAFSTETMAVMNVLIFSSILIVDNRKVMAYLTLFTFGFVLLAVLMVADGDQKWLFLLLTFVVLFVGNLSVAARNMTRRQMQHRLQNSRAIQEAAIENNANAILLVDEKGSFVQANAAYSALWDIPLSWIAENRLQEVEKQTLEMLESPAIIQELWKNAISQTSEDAIVELCFKNGKIVEASWRTLFEGSLMLGRLWFFHDITPQKQAEAILIARHKRTNELNQHLMDFATKLGATSENPSEAYKSVIREAGQLLNVGRVEIWSFDENETVVELQEGYSKGKGFTRDPVRIVLSDHSEYFDILIKSRLLVVPDTRVVEFSKFFLEGNYTGRATAFMHAQIRVEGKFVGVLAFEETNGPRVWSIEEQSFVSSLADLMAISISAQEKQKSQESLSNSLALLKAIFDLSETGIIVEDDDHKVLNFNELYLRMWNMTPEFVQNSPYKVIVEHLLGQIRNSESYIEGLERLKMRPGMEYAGFIEFHDGRIVERYSKAIMVEGGKQGRVWFYLDITERKLKENELINRNFELDSFVYRASHDLKAPLNSIMGLISIIFEEQDRDAILQYVRMMDKSVKKLDEFIRQLTQFSQDARVAIVRSNIDLKQFLTELLEDLSFMENAKRLKVVMDIEQNEDFHSDPVRLGIVFNNLLSNAIKYQDLQKPNSELRIQIRADRFHADCRFIDNGQGIDEEHQEKIFDLFFRASIQATGSGLGLYITHNAVQKLGGKIAVESSLGEGSSFHLGLPSIPEPEFEPSMN